MKAKMFEKKLILKKQTISHLEDIEMKQALGGGNTDDVCPTWFYTCDQWTCRTNCQ